MASGETNKRTKRTGGIVAAIALAIAAAFIAVILLLFNQNVNFATIYTENETDLVSDEVLIETTACLEERSVLMESGISDSDLIRALTHENTASASGNVEEATASAAEIGSLLQGLVVDTENSTAFLASLATGKVYLAQGTASQVGQTEEIAAWAESLKSSIEPGSSNPFLTTDVITVGSGDKFVVNERRLMRDGRVVGILGTCIHANAFSNVMASCLSEEGQEAIYFAQDGSVLFGPTLKSTDSNVFTMYPEIASLKDELTPGESQRWRVWSNIDGLIPHDQRLFEVRYSPPIDAYLLCASSGTTIFGQMRENSTTLLLVLLVVMILFILLAVTGVRWYRSHLIKITATDELTGLANRKSFAESYEQAFQGEDVGVASIALIDVDHFKQINDTYGHAAGDEALASIAAEVRDAVGPDGLSGRWGGDEFIGVFRMPPEAARANAQRMIERVSKLKFSSGMETSISVGLAEVDASLTLEHMVERADEALYITKEGGRGFLTVYDTSVTKPKSKGELESEQRPVDLLTHEDSEEEYSEDSEQVAASTSGPTRKPLAKLVMKSLLDAVRKMIPFVAGGGILVAVAFLFDAASVDLNSLPPEARANFGSITPIASGLHELGLAAFNFMLPVFSAFFARGMAGNKAFMAGFAGGYLSSQGSAGFVGAVLTALLSALVVRLMDNLFRGASDLVRRIASVLIIPVFSLLVMYLLMIAVIEPVATVLDTALTSLLASLAEGNRVVLGAVLGGMMSTDMGGFVNKAAYHFGTASIAAGSPDIMAAVMVGGMVAPCGIALSMLLFRGRFTSDECDLIPTTFVLGLSFITEGAIPFVLADFARVIPSCILGSALAGAISMASGCTLMAPHGGIFVFPVVGNPMMYVVALAAGSLLSAVVLGFLKRFASKHEE